MKKTIHLCFLLLLLAFGFGSFAQNKHTIHYQGIARNAQGHPLASTTIAIRLSIKDALNEGNTLYSETKSVATNAFGMYSISINDGTGSHTGSFDNISWVPGSRFLMTEIDPANGIAFVNMGTASLQSVPHAISAKNLEGVSNPQKGDLLEFNNGSWISKPSPKHYSATGDHNLTTYLNFIGPTITFVVERENPRLHLSMTYVFGSSNPSGGRPVELNLGFRKNGGPIQHFDLSRKIAAFQITSHQILPVTLNGVFQTEFEIDQSYEVGIIGQSQYASDWNQNSNGSGDLLVTY